jgi:hypothetical protein
LAGQLGLEADGIVNLVLIDTLLQSQPLTFQLLLSRCYSQ